MYNYFLCKVRYDKVQDDGRDKKVTEPLLNKLSIFYQKTLIYLTN
jgi:hypothetical protein